MATRTQSPPYASYALIMGVFAGGLAAAGAVGNALRRDPQCQTPLDFVLGRGRGAGRSGMEQAIGELVTCTRCIATLGADIEGGRARRKS